MSTDTREALAAERAAFEEFIARDGGDLSTFGSGAHVHYRNSAVNNAWTGWTARAAIATPAAPAQPEPSELPVAYIVSGKPLVWSKAYDDQWLDEDYGFSIMLERDSETPYNAAWGEGDSEDFATLEEAKAWCQAEIDAWARRSVVVTPAQPSAQGEAVAWLVEWKADGYGPQWWGFNHTPGKNGTWCSNANNAIRFARKEDAERMRLHIIAVVGLTGMHGYERSVCVTEHMWEGPCRVD